MKRKLFIASSSEGLKVAEKIKLQIENQCYDWIDVNVWNGDDIFTLNSSTLDSLIRVAMQYDYAVIVATNDDIIKSRGKQKIAARDNVIFEAGLFMGSLGKNRAFIVADKEINLPTDFNGTTVCFYDPINNVYSSIISELNKTQHSYRLSLLPSAAMAMGYYENYIIPFCKNREHSKLKVIIPQKFDSIDKEIQNHKSKQTSKTCRRLLFWHSRPTGFKYKNKNDCYWDIPTTLQTIRNLLKNIIPQQEIGKNTELDEWLRREMCNFGYTLKELISADNLCMDRIEIVII